MDLFNHSPITFIYKIKEFFHIGRVRRDSQEEQQVRQSLCYDLPLVKPDKQFRI